MGARCIVMRAVDGEGGKTDGQKKNRMEKVGSDGLGRVRRVGSGKEGLIPYPGYQ